MDWYSTWYGFKLLTQLCSYQQSRNGNHIRVPLEVIFEVCACVHTSKHKLKGTNSWLDKNIGRSTLTS